MVTTAVNCIANPKELDCLPSIGESKADVPEAWGRDLENEWRNQAKAMHTSCAKEPGILESLDACTIDPAALGTCLKCVMAVRTHEAVASLDLLGVSDSAVTDSLVCEGR